MPDHFLILPEVQNLHYSISKGVETFVLQLLKNLTLLEHWLAQRRPQEIHSKPEMGLLLEALLNLLQELTNHIGYFHWVTRLELQR